MKRRGEEEIRKLGDERRIDSSWRYRGDRKREGEERKRGGVEERRGENGARGRRRGGEEEERNWRKMKWEDERKSEREERITSRSEQRGRGERIGRRGSWR